MKAGEKRKIRRKMQNMKPWLSNKSPQVKFFESLVDRFGLKNVCVCVRACVRVYVCVRVRMCVCALARV